jgi:hypothetical protein
MLLLEIQIPRLTNLSLTYPHNNVSLENVAIRAESSLNRWKQVEKNRFAIVLPPFDTVNEERK